MLTIINYGLGNINSFANIFKSLGAKFNIATNSDDLKNTSSIILPGVGSFDWAITRLNNSGMRSTLDDKVMVDKCNVLGVCVGMQIMANESEEGSEEGLGWIEGTVRKLPTKNKKIKLPHMGWNNISLVQENKLIRNISDKNFYFLHSYFFDPVNPKYIGCSTDYNFLFPSVISKKNIYGVQFHPEKSHLQGINLLKNFITL